VFFLSLLSCDKILNLPGNLAHGPVNNSAAQCARSAQGQGPHFAGNPPLHDQVIAENGEKDVAHS